MMRSDTSFHADQACGQIGQSRFHLATRPLLPQHKRTALVLAYNVERVLADIDADGGDSGIENLTWRAPCLRCPTPASITGGAGARPDHPISGHRARLS